MEGYMIRVTGHVLVVLGLLFCLSKTADSAESSEKLTLVRMALAARSTTTIPISSPKNAGFSARKVWRWS
jgi:hypothetical protein